jgi:hypothetical protein
MAASSTTVSNEDPEVAARAARQAEMDAQIAAVKAAQDANAPPKDPAVLAQEAKNAADIAALEATRASTQPQPSQSEMIAALKAEQDKINAANGVKPTTITDEEAAAVQAAAAAQGPIIVPLSQVNKSTVVPDDDPRAVALKTAQAKTAADLAASGKGKVNTEANEVVTTAPKPPSVKYPVAPDWRFRVSLAPNADYFYNAADAGILAPLKSTKGVIFPYTPTVSVSYVAKYDTQTPTHSNFSINNYQHSSVEQVTVTGDFTAQDIQEANYLLATIHFFKSATKMFYGKDKTPARGVPPPLLYLSGFGQYQFDNHPVVLTNFTYTLPVDVDYINAYPNGTKVGVNGAQLAAFNQQKKTGDIRAFIERLKAAVTKGSKKGGGAEGAAPTLSQSLTRVPTKISISLTFQPIVTRNAISNEFSLKDYASGKLLRGSQNKNTGGGIW